jgi:transposase
MSYTVFRGWAWIGAACGAGKPCGGAALKAKPTPGRPAKLDEGQRKQLERWLLKGAQTVFASDRWTCQRVAALIERRLGVAYHARQVPRVLRSLGWALQRPARRAVERDEVAIQHWIKHDWPRGKNARRLNAWIAIGCGRISVCTRTPTWHGEEVIAFLQALKRHLGTGYLVWDHLQAHRAGPTPGFLDRTPAIRQTYFPSYAPGLNPVESGWNWPVQSGSAQTEIA